MFFLLLHQSVEAGLEVERLQREGQETQWVSEAEAQAQVLRVKAQLKSQERQAVQLESSCRAVDRSLGQSSKRLQVRQMHAVQPHGFRKSKCNNYRKSEKTASFREN